MRKHRLLFMLVARPPLQPNSLEPRKSRKKPLPFPFIIDALAPLNPLVRPMFGGHAVYVGDKVVLMLRNRDKSPQDNGLWVVFSESFDPAKDLDALRAEFPSLRRIDVLGGGIRHWLVLPAEGPNFESEALYACDRLFAHDDRFGRIPKSRQTKPRRR